MSELPAGMDASQRVLAALKEARARLEAAERAATEPIAVVGIGCRFPGGADGPDAYWRLLRDGVDASGEIPRNRYDADAYYDPRPRQPGRIATRRGSFLAAIEMFDAGFFAISPREAVSLDPQQRLLLEVAWEALEHAGQAPDQLRGSRSGVFVGVGRTDYAHRLLRAAPEAITAWHATGNGLCYGPGRLAHMLDFRGPNLAIDTACSSSLVAVHLACQSLRLRECDLAIAGGCHVHLSPQIAIMLSASRALAADGRCKTFDASADGFGQGEGCGIIVLRRLSDALAHRDNILALIRGSATNHDGHSSGLTVPNQDAQEQVIRDALANARVEPHDIGYLEAHGTGTALGDPIEVDALAAVLCAGRPHDRPLQIGSVKTNIGHLEASAGIAGLIKVVLTLQHACIPPHLHLRQPNPRIAWDALPIRVPTAATAWPKTARHRVAGVSSFGMSGTNAHVILQEAPAPPADAAECERPLHLLTLSARSPESLRSQARRLRTHLVANEDQSAADVAHTLNSGRTHFAVRAGLVAAGRAEFLEQLAALGCGEVQPDTLAEDQAEPPGIVFLFSGQGSQYAGMARQLYATQPVVRGVLDRCDEILRPLLLAPLREVLFAEPDDARLGQTLYTQPALFAVEYALAELWRAWGVVPDAVLGHSVGEYVAACVAGVFSLEDGLRLIAERARLMQALPGGAMAAVFAGEARVRAAIGVRSDVSVAAINGRENVVIAGLTASVSDLLAHFNAQGIGFRELSVSHAFHSPMMEPMLAPFGLAARRIGYAPPRIDLISNVSGDFHAQAPGAGDWVRHVREPVRFADGLDRLARGRHRVFIEVGPGTALLASARRHLGGAAAALLPTLMPGKDEWRPLLESVAQLYQQGVRIDWTGFDRGYARRRVPLPTYPFERQRFWYDDEEQARSAPTNARAFPAIRLTWQEHAPPAANAAQSRQPGSWIIFAGRDGIGTRIASLLESRGERCLHVEAGELFTRTSSMRWTVDPDSPMDVARLIDEMPDPADRKGIVFAWTCDLDPSADSNGADVMSAQMRGCASLLHLVQALAKHPRHKARVWLVTRNTFLPDAASGDLPNLSHAAIAGMARTIALEHPELWGGMIDVPREADDGVLKQLLRELDRQTCEDQILLRNGRRFVARIAPHDVSSAGRIALRRDAAYLVTGGLGGLGLHVARSMVERGARNIVLLGRRDPSPAAQAAILDLRGRGATVTTVRADVAEATDLQQVFAQLETSGPALRGVVHAAGVSGYDAFGALDAPALRRVLRPKVEGAWLLHQLTRPLELDFFVCFSSIAALWGSKGQAHYAAANAFLDALAHYRRGRGLPALSIGWGPWQGDGMVEDKAQERLARIGVRALRPADAIAALECALSCGEAQIAIADIDWKKFRQLYAFGAMHGLLADVALDTPGAAAPAPLSVPDEAGLAHLTAAERRDALVARLQREVGAVLGLAADAPPDVRTGFFRLGMDSVMAVDLRDRLSRAFGVPLAATIAFDYPNIAELAHLLVTTLEAPPHRVEPSAAAAPAAPPPGVQSHSGADAQEAIALKLARLETLMREI